MKASGTKDRAGAGGRKERLAVALRENLRKRKAQARGRAAGAEEDSGPHTAPRNPSPAKAAREA